MEPGVLGPVGQHAQLLVGVEIKTGQGNATIQLLPMEDCLVLARALKTQAAIPRHVQSVKYFN